MEVFVQQLINGITLGSIYGLIAIGYTMVFGIIGMVNFAHGDVFMVSTFIALIAFLILTTWLGIGSIVLALFIVLIVAMVLTSLVNWTIERVAYRPLRGSFRLAPLISAIGMSIFLIELRAGRAGPAQQVDPADVQRRHRADGRATATTVTHLLQAAHHLGRSPRSCWSPSGILVTQDRARPRAARLRAGPEDGGAGRHRRRPHDLDHLRDRRRARRRRRHACTSCITAW